MNPWRFCGEYFDREADTLYLRARHYDPRTGRFGAEDSAGDGLNWYTYCGNTPVRFVDPSGNFATMVRQAPRVIRVLWSISQGAKSNSTGFALTLSSALNIILGGSELKAGLLAGPEIFSDRSGLITESPTTDSYIDIFFEGAQQIFDAVSTYFSKRKPVDVPQPEEEKEYKKPVSGTGKEKSDDVPNWAKGNAPYVGENGNDFAKRLLDKKYAEGNWKTGPASEHNKIRKWGDRSFK